MKKGFTISALAVFILIGLFLTGCEKTAKTYLHSGNSKFLSKQYEEAVKDYNKAIEMDPKLAEAYFQRGKVYKRLEKFDLAKKDFLRVIELEPNGQNSGTAKKEIEEIESSGL